MRYGKQEGWKRPKGQWTVESPNITLGMVSRCRFLVQLNSGQTMSTAACVLCQDTQLVCRHVWLLVQMPSKSCNPHMPAAQPRSYHGDVTTTTGDLKKQVRLDRVTCYDPCSAVWRLPV